MTERMALLRLSLSALIILYHEVEETTECESAGGKKFIANDTDD